MTPDDVTLRFRAVATGQLSEYLFRPEGTAWVLDETVGACEGTTDVSFLSVSPDVPEPLPDRATVVWTEAGNKRKVEIGRTERANEWVVAFETWTGAKWHSQRELPVKDIRLDVAEETDTPIASV